MKKVIAILIVVATLVTLSCTKDFVVKDIKNQTLTINAPNDSLSTASNAVTFWWDELDGAEKYNIQIVKPSFSAVQQLLVDTNVITNKFNYTFSPGTYQWRIRATNAGGSTAYITRTLIVDSTSNLSSSSVILVSPLSLSVTASTNLTFSWNTLYSATSYELMITNTITGSVTTIPNITNTNYTYSFSTLTGTEENYRWQVKAFNSLTGTQTLNNTSRSFKIDKKSPSAPSILSPNTYSINLNDTTKLTWSRNISSTDTKYDILYISSDSTFSSILGSTTIYTVTPTIINSIYSYSGTPLPVWWRATSVDSVGNISTPSQSKRFYLK